MAVGLYTSVANSCSMISSPYYSPKISPSRSISTSISFSPKTIYPRHHSIRIAAKPALKLQVASTRGHPGAGICCCFFNHDNPKNSLVEKDNDLNWRILKRWDVPWNWQTICLTSVACVLSYYKTARIREAALQFTGLRVEGPSLEAKLSLLDQGIFATMILAVMYILTKAPYPQLPNDIYRFDWREPLDLKKGWLLWAGVGIGGTLVATQVLGAALSFFRGTPKTEISYGLARLLPLLGSSTIGTASVVSFTGVVGPILWEIFFRGFFMVSLTKWLPTPVATLITAFVVAAHNGNPQGFPSHFLLGTALGFSYAQTRNLLTPIAFSAFWGNGFTLILIFLKTHGYDLKEFLQLY